MLRVVPNPLLPETSSFLHLLQVYLTSTGQTTNENSKWGDIKDWYKKEQKRYRRAVRDGKVPPAPQQQGQEQQQPTTTPSAAAAAAVLGAADDDRDVTCTPSVGGAGGKSSGEIPSSKGNDDDATKTTAEASKSTLLTRMNRDGEAEVYTDPGPVPKNIYNRGFVENWREVLFPLSLREDALARGGYTRLRPRNPATAPAAAPTSSDGQVPPPTGGSKGAPVVTGDSSGGGGSSTMKSKST